MSALIPYSKRNDLVRTGFGDWQNMLGDFFAEDWPLRSSLIGDALKIDLQDNEKDYVVEAEVPGIPKDNIHLSLEDGRLHISVSQEEVKEEKDKHYVHRERRYSSMARNIYLADAASEGIKAKLDDGILTITVPKDEHHDHSKMIEIE
jgi:HSP20 family protein